jgi:cohesin complex subunit SCC1
VDDEPKVLSFNRISDKASRRAASAFFFELLLLGTRDHIKLQQPGAFENIEVSAKDKLWAQTSERLSSAVPSVLAS